MRHHFPLKFEYRIAWCPHFRGAYDNFVYKSIRWDWNCQISLLFPKYFQRSFDICRKGFVAISVAQQIFTSYTIVTISIRSTLAVFQWWIAFDNHKSWFSFNSYACKLHLRFQHTLTYRISSQSFIFFIAINLFFIKIYYGVNSKKMPL